MKTATLKPRRLCSWKSYVMDTVCRSSIAGPALVVDMRIENGLARCDLAQAGAGVSAGFDARTARLFSFWAFSLSICSLAAFDTRGFRPGAFAPSLGFAAALPLPFIAAPRPLPVARPRFGGPSALHKVRIWSMDWKTMVHTSRPEALVPEEPKDHCTQRIRPY